MAVLPKVHIPVTVDTKGVDTGLKSAEAKVRASTSRMARTVATAPAAPSRTGAIGRAATSAAFSKIGGGPLGGIVGAAGTAGAPAAGVAGMLLLANTIDQALRQVSTGATEALRTFNETGKQTFAANENVLRALANLEKRQESAGRGGFTEAFIASSAARTGGGGAGVLSEFGTGGRLLMAGIGAVAGGAVAGTAGVEALAATATNETEARRFQNALVEERRAREAEGYRSFWEAPISYLADTIAGSVYDTNWTEAKYVARSI